MGWRRLTTPQPIDLFISKWALGMVLTSERCSPFEGERAPGGGEGEAKRKGEEEGEEEEHG